MERLISDSKLSKNGQITLKKAIRELLDIDISDRIFVQVIKVESPEGVTKYHYLEERE